MIHINQWNGVAGEASATVPGPPDSEKEKVMATAEKKPRKGQKSKAKKAAGFTGFIANAYRKTMDTSESVSLTAVNLPFMFLEGMGVPEDKTKGLKGINEKFVGGVFKGTDWLTTNTVALYVAPFKLFGSAVKKMTGKAEAKPAKKDAKKADKKTEKKAEKKAAPTKAPKKAPKAKKQPPKVAAKKPAPIRVETKKAA